MDQEMKRLRERYGSKARRTSSGGWREVRGGVIDQWHVGRIVTANGTVVFPPAQIRTTTNRPVPVLTGVTVRPGDTPQSVVRQAVADHPIYLGQYRPEELRLQVNDN